MPELRGIRETLPGVSTGHDLPERNAQGGTAGQEDRERERQRE